jgi:hypothetical protein
MTACTRTPLYRVIQFVHYDQATEIAISAAETQIEA